MMERRKYERRYNGPYRSYHKKSVNTRAKSQYIKRTYGVSLDEYSKLFEEQEGRCSICRRHESEFERSLSIDHDHFTGKVRGLLCTGCNLHLGKLEGGNFKYDGEFVKMCQDYLSKSCV